MSFNRIIGIILIVLSIAAAGKGIHTIKNNQASIEILDLQGKIHYQFDLGQLAKGQYEIPLELSDLASGMYHLTLQSPTGFFSQLFLQPFYLVFGFCQNLKT